jgi:hypothetical protein
VNALHTRRTIVRSVYLIDDLNSHRVIGLNRRVIALHN